MDNRTDFADDSVRADYERHRQIENVRNIPYIQVSFLVICGLFVFSDLYLRHEPLYVYIRVVPYLLSIGVLISWYWKVSPKQLMLWQTIWAYSYLFMFYGFTIVTYKIPAYHSAIVSVLIGIFTVLLGGMVTMRGLALLYTVPFLIFFGVVTWMGLADDRLTEMSKVVALMVICFILYGIREQYAFSNYQLTRQLEQAIAQMKATQTQLVHKEKMASLGELTAGIAHEIQNPLNFVTNFSEVSTELAAEIREEDRKADRDADLVGELLDDLTQNLQKITHHGGRASAIVRGMLEHSRTSTGEKRSTDLNALADEYLKIAYHGQRAKDKKFNAELTTDFQADMAKAEVVPQELVLFQFSY